MKIVITCAGDQTRWNNYLGVHKQMAPVFGVPLLQRTVQAMNKVFPDSDVFVSIQHQSKKRLYVVDGKYEFYVLPQFNRDDAALKSLVPFYKETDDDILVMLGDVVFSQDCINKIHNVITREQSKGSSDIKAFGRKYLSKNINHKFGEVFAYHIPHQVKSKFIEAIEIVDNYYSRKLLTRKSGWEIFSCYFSKNKTVAEIKKLFQRKNFPFSSFITIDDETDDFDYPPEYEHYISKIARNAQRVTSKSWISTAPTQLVYLLLYRIKTTIETVIINSASKFLPVPVKKIIKKIVGWDKFYS
jgi:hypothetical protein